MEFITRRPCRYKEMGCLISSVINPNICDSRRAKKCKEKARREELEKKLCPIMEKLGYTDDLLECSSFKVRALLPHYVGCNCKDGCPMAMSSEFQKICRTRLLNMKEDARLIASLFEEVFKIKIGKVA